MLLQYAFFIDGLSVALYYLKDRYKMSKGVITLIIFLTMFSQLSIVYFILGLADLIIDFRKLDPNRKLGVK
ncbi:Predicted membrane protein [Clostridium tetanomorphum]|nr:Predicted membrane protein [Clostridium tetanomorphum]